MIKKITTIFFLGLLLLIPTTGIAAAASNISIDSYYLVVSPTNNGSTNMMVMAEYSNSSSQDFKGDGTSAGVLKVTLPPGTTGFNFLDNKIKTQKTSTGFIAMEPIKAKSTEVLPYSYQMPEGKSMNLTFDYPVQTMQVLVPQGMGSVAFQGVDSTDQGPFQFDGQNYEGYDVEGINAGQTFSMTYDENKQPANASASTSSTSTSAPSSASTQTGAKSASSRSVTEIVIVASVIILIILAGTSSYIYFKKKAKLQESRVDSNKEEDEFQLLMSKQKAIIEKIVELEENRGNGDLPEGEYNKKLDAYKEHLVKVKLGLRKFVE